MSMIVCPSCGRQVSNQASSCPQCGHPISAPPAPSSGGGGCLVGFLILVVVLVILAISNPSETDMRQKIGQDGWVPTSFERTNLIVVSWVKVTGATGAKATYLGIGGQVLKISG